jgi:XTP/dITP diphosphohydrolase
VRVAKRPPQRRRRLLLATLNPGKQEELRALLEASGLTLVAPQELGLELDVPEPADDYDTNARLKALAFASASGLWSLADDTGLEVDALDGAPGTRSRRLAGPNATDADRRRALLEALAGRQRPWTARFRCAMVLAGPRGSVHLSHGECEGEVVPEARGEHGFGYDPIFLVAGTSRTMAELEPAEKNRISHRARALEALRPALRRSLGVLGPG